MTNISDCFANAVKDVFLDLFKCHEMDINKAEMTDLSKTVDDITILLKASGKLTGNVFLAMSTSFALELASMMIGFRVTEVDELCKSSLSEISNIISGNAMINLSELGYYCETTIPTIIIGKNKNLMVKEPIGLYFKVITPIGPLSVGLMLE